MSIATYPVLADAYPRSHWRKENRVFHTHSVERNEAGEIARVICRRVKLENICDNDPQQITQDEPTCPVCASAFRERAASAARNGSDAHGK